MAYKYITDNNLYDKQNYMYSEYGGIGFISEYLKSRQNCLQGTEEDSLEDSFAETVQGSNLTRQALQELLQKLKNGQNNSEIIHTVNKYTKSFEVRKRLYTEYDGRLRPTENAGFEDYKSYLILAECLIYTYKYTKCLKYFSCLLKIDDTLLSVRDRLEDKDREYLCNIVSKELEIFYQLADKNGIGVEVKK